MALDKQSLPLNFALGLDTKTDPWQVKPGNFLLLENTVFQVGGQMRKRNGFQKLTNLPAGINATGLATWNDNLLALGNNLYSFDMSSSQWRDRGIIRPVSLDVQPLVRTAYSTTVPDVAISPGGLACSVFVDGDGLAKYQISQAASGQVVVGITNLPTTAGQTRVFLLNNFFIITFIATVSAVTHLQYIAIPLTNLTNPSVATDLSTTVDSLTAGYDAYSVNNTLFVAWAGSDVGGAIHVRFLNGALAQSAEVVFPGFDASLMSVYADVSGSSPVIWVTAYDAGDAYTWALNSTLAPLLSAAHTITATTIQAFTSTAQNDVCTLFYEVINAYAYDSAIRTDYIETNTVTLAGVVGSPTIIERSVGLGSKAFLLDGIAYMVASYGGPQAQTSFEPTNFLIDQFGNEISRFATLNAAGYVTNQVLPSVSLMGNSASIGYLYRALIQPLNRTQGGVQGGFYSQMGVNLITFDLSNTAQNTAEIGGTLLLSGGFLWMYDGVKPVEQGFHLFPENVEVTPMGGGSMDDNIYFYQVTYEWTDGNGNIHRSSPSVPTPTEITGGSGTGEVVLDIPTLRLTYKTAPNAVRIVIYRWSATQQVYYQVTDVTAPLLNDPSVDSVSFTDTLNDSSILGNNILYTMGGVIENTPGPACDVIALFDDRVFLVNSEDRNSLAFSKQVIEATPVEMSDFFTSYVAPSTGAQGSTGLLRAIFPMDDKLILFKPNALAYINGSGPDNTGLNNQYSQPIFITSTIGSSNPKSIVFEPQGLIFDSGQGRWLLGRDLSTNYIGAPVALYNSIPAVSALNIPEQNQVRLTLPNATLTYNYFYNQWGTFTGIPAISSTIYRNNHTFLNSSGQVYQELANSYTDGPEPVLMGFDTGWFNLAGLQGYQRSYFFFLLGQYLSPHKISIAIAYDYNDSPSQSMLIQPINYAAPYGDDSYYGDSSPYGGPGNVEQWRIFFGQQKHTAFKIYLREIYDPTLATIPGPGFTLSGLNLIYGAKSSYPRLPAVQSIS